MAKGNFYWHHGNVQVRRITPKTKITLVLDRQWHDKDPRCWHKEFKVMANGWFTTLRMIETHIPDFGIFEQVFFIRRKYQYEREWAGHDLKSALEYIGHKWERD